MKVMKILVTATVVTCLPAVIGGQAMLDLGDHGAAFAKNEDKGNSDKGNSGKENSGRGGSENANSDKAGKTDKSGGANKDKSTSSKTGADKSAGKPASKGKNPFSALKDAFGKKSTKKNGAAKLKSAASSSQKSTLKTATVKTAKATVAGANLHSQLKGLNSLNRNINGLINGNDPKMDPIRDFVYASAEFEAAKTNLKEYGVALETARDDFADAVAELGIEWSDGQTMLDQYNELVTKHALGEPAEPQEPVPPAEGVENYETLYSEYQQAYTKWEQDHASWQTEHSAWETTGKELEAAAEQAAALEGALGDYDAAAKTLVDSADAVSAEALQQAMADALNATGARTVGPEDITPEMLDWASAQLGVGDADGLIDEYIALEAAKAEAATEEADSGEDDEEDETEDAEAVPPEEDPLAVAAAQ